MTITRSQAQKAVGEGQDIDYWLGVLKANEKVELRHWNKVAQDLALRICKKGNFEYYPGGGNGFEAAWAAEWSPESYNTNDCVYRLHADYEFATDCPKTVDCANYESSCEGECENFKPKGRTFTEAFLDDDTIPYGALIGISGVQYTKCSGQKYPRLAQISDIDKRGGSPSHHPFAIFEDGRWIYTADIQCSPADLMESDIAEIVKPEVK